MISFVRRAVTNKTGVPLQATGKVVTACKQLLEIQGIFDVDCELKESIACRHGPGDWTHHTDILLEQSRVQVSFTPTIGTYISR